MLLSLSNAGGVYQFGVAEVQKGPLLLCSHPWLSITSEPKGRTSEPAASRWKHASQFTRPLRISLRARRGGRVSASPHALQAFPEATLNGPRPNQERIAPQAG